MTEQTAAGSRLSLTTKLTYGLGSVAYGVGGTALGGATVTYFLNQVIGLHAALVGTVIAASIIIDAIIDPLVGQWSDNFRSPWGRRHPFMYAAAVPTALAFYFLWNPPTGLSNEALLVFMMFLLVVVRICVSLYEIPSTALAPELAPGYDDRTSLLSFRYFFGVTGSLVMGTLLNLVFIAKTAANPEGPLNREGYGHFGATAATIMVVAILISSLATHREIPKLRQPPARAVTLGQTFRELAQTFANPSLLALIASGLISGLGGGMTSALSAYFNFHIWGLTPQATVWFVLGYFPATITGSILAPIAAKRMGKKRAMISLFAVSLCAMLIPLSLRMLNVMPPNGHPLLLPILVVDTFVAALLGISGYIIVSSMIADVVEDNAVRTGVRSEGLLFATNGLLPKITGAVGGFIGTLILTGVHFPDHAVPGTVDPAILRQMVLIYLPITAIFNGAAIAVLVFYKIDRASHERNQELLRQAEAGAATIELATEVGARPPGAI
ncbi:MAG: MFS transporter [Caulobacteraceae bacterium]